MDNQEIDPEGVVEDAIGVAQYVERAVDSQIYQRVEISVGPEANEGAIIYRIITPGRPDPIWKVRYEDFTPRYDNEFVASPTRGTPFKVEVSSVDWEAIRRLLVPEDLIERIFHVQELRQARGVA